MKLKSLQASVICLNYHWSARIWQFQMIQSQWCSAWSFLKFCVCMCTYIYLPVTLSKTFPIRFSQVCTCVDYILICSRSNIHQCIWPNFANDFQPLSHKLVDGFPLYRFAIYFHHTLQNSIEYKHPIPQPIFSVSPWMILYFCRTWMVSCYASHTCTVHIPVWQCQ